MVKTARPALSNAIQCLKQNWRCILLLAIKTYIFVYLSELVIRSLSVKFLDAQALERWKNNFIETFNDYSFRENIPINEVVSYPNQENILLIIITAVGAWLTAPLFTSLTRTVVLAEQFDQHLFTRLTEKRCLKVALVSWLPLVLLLCFTFFKTSLIKNPSFTSATIVVLFIFGLYLFIRAFYLIPVVAVDYPLSSLKQAWIATKNKTWSIFKTLFIVSLAYYMMSFVIGFLIQMVGGVLPKPGHLIMFSVLHEVLLRFLLDITFITAIASLYKQSQK